jgi:predicted amidohydrolase
MNEKIKIGSWQGLVEEDLSRNIVKVEKVLEESKDLGLDFICFPETYLSGYSPEAIRENALSLEDKRLTKLITEFRSMDSVILVGMSEKQADKTFNSQVVFYKGEILGVYHKTMLTDYDQQCFSTDLVLPVFEAKGVRFGVIICHDTSFVEPALYLRWKGARLLFTPHFNNLPPTGILTSTGEVSFWEHRSMVLNNQAALATLLKMVVVRSNVIVIHPDSLGTGEGGIWGMNGDLLAKGEPFRECMVTQEFEKNIFLKEHWINRAEVPSQLLDMIAEAAKEYPRPTGRHEGE